MTARSAVAQPRIVSSALAGAVADLADGVVLGMLMAMMGHLLYGVITALVFVPLSRRL